MQARTRQGRARGAMRRVRWLAALALPLAAHGQARYVAPGGVDGTNECLSSAYPCGSIAHAVTNTSVNGDTVFIAPGVYTESEFVLDRKLFLAGAGPGTTIVQAAVAPGAATSRVFRVALSGDAEVRGVTIRHGRAADGEPGGAGRDGGGIAVNGGKLILVDCEVVDNRAGNGGAGLNGGSGGRGGAVYSDGVFIASNTLFARNESGSGGAGTGLTPDGLGGDAGVGAAIVNAGGVALLAQSALVSNRCGAGGSGVVGGKGGSAAVWNNGTIEIVNATISGNTAGPGGTGSMQGGAGGGAGGIENELFGTSVVRHCTITRNSTGAGGAGPTPGAAGSGGGLRLAAGTLALSHAIVWSNSVAPGGSAPDASGVLESVDFSLIGDAAGWSIAGLSNAVLTGIDAELGPLRDNGGPTPTHRPRVFSPVLDAGDPAGSFPQADQRGLFRVQGLRVDLGALEEQEGPRHVALDGSDLTNDCRDAGAPCATIAYAMDAALHGDVVQLATGIFAATEWVVTKSIGIRGVDATSTVLQAAALPGVATGRVLRIPPGRTVTVERVSIRHGVAPRGADGGAPDESGANGEHGGGIFNEGVLEVRDARIEWNRAGDGGAGHGLGGGGSGGYGGGIYSEGEAALSNVVLIGNAAGSGGDGAFGGEGGGGGGVASPDGVLQVVGSSIVSNAAGAGGAGTNGDGGVGGAGGGIFSGGALAVDRTSVLDNEAGAGGSGTGVGGDGGAGGGLFSEGSPASIHRSRIRGNRAGDGGIPDGLSGAGGGVFSGDSTEVVNTTLSENSASSGGGLYNLVILDVLHATVVSNSASDEGGGLYQAVGAVTLLGHSIVAWNGAASAGPDASGDLASGDFNAILDTNGYAIVSGSTAGSFFGLDPQLGPEADLGGDTVVFPLAAGSPLIDAGNPAIASPPPTDQRGFQRVEGGRIDIGAYEFPDPDDDSDGLPDEWEIEYGLDPFDPGTTNAVSGPAGDGDGDLQSNVEEYMALTNPTNPASFFRVSQFGRSNAWRVAYFARTGRVYTLAVSTSLVEQAWSPVPGSIDVPGTDATNVLTDVIGPTSRVYRLQVRFP